MGDKPIMAGTDTRDARSANYGDAFAAVRRARRATARRRARRAGEKTLRKILDAALAEFGERGFSESSIVGITRRARVALGTFYTYFDSKEAVFQALVRDMSARVRDHVAADRSKAPSTGSTPNARALASYLDFVVGHKEVYRIIDEAEFVDPEGFRRHYVTTAERIAGATCARRVRAARSRDRKRRWTTKSTPGRSWA